MFRAIDQSEYMVALNILEKIRNTIEIRENLAEQGKLHKNVALPSDLWKIINLYSYTLNPSYEIVNTWRFHTFPFTGRYIGVNLPCYWRPIPELLNSEYQKITLQLPEEMIARPPCMLGEIGWEVRGGLVNEEVLTYQNHVASLYLSGAIDHLRSKDSIRVLEIGSGYGGLAYQLWKILKPSSFYLVDIPESLAFSSVYLSLTTGADDACIYDGNVSSLTSPPQKWVCLCAKLLSR